MASGVSSAVRVTARIAPTGRVRREFGRTLFVDRADAVIDELTAALRIRKVGVYATATALAEDDPSDDLEAAAEVYFQQSPYPRNLLVGTHIETAQPAFIFGSPLGSVADIEALGNGVTLPLNGQNITVDLDGLTTYDAIATAVAAGINADPRYSGVTVAAVVSGSDTFLRIQGTTSFGAGFDATTPALFGLVGDGVNVLAPQAAEEIDEALDRIEMLDCSFTWVGINKTSTAVLEDVRDVANWVAARPQFGFIFDVVGNGVLAAGEDTSIGAVISALQQNAVSAIYNGDAVDYKALSLMARFSSVNFSAVRSLITAKFKSLPGTTPTNLSQAQKDELDRKRINYYTPVGDGADVAEGTSFGTWIDIDYWLKWLVNALEVAQYNVLKQNDRVNQTDQGQAALLGAITGVLEDGVTNGGIAPGQVDTAITGEIQAVTGNTEFTGFLSTGYLVYVESFAMQSAADRNARKSPPPEIWLKGSGAIHSADVNVQFVQ